MKNLKVTALEYHRNGVGGIGFAVARFTFEETVGAGEFSAVATIFSSDEKFTGYCAVLVEGEDGKIDITSKWRGDHFEEELRQFIASAAGQKMMFPFLSAQQETQS